MGYGIYRIRKGSLGDWLKKLEPQWRVVHPCLGSCAEALPDKGRLVPEPGARESLKGILMPLENLLGAGGSAGAADERPVLAWGVRPCDMKGAALLDRIFADRMEDPVYARRRVRIVFAGFACTRRGPACFCHLVGVDRTAAQGMDLMLVDDGDGFLVAAMTGAGERMVEAGGNLLEEAGESGRSRMDEALERARGEDRETAHEAWGGRSLELVVKGLEGRWKSDLWERTADTCLGCGVCSFVCPLCWCFDVRDVPGSMMESLLGRKPEPVGEGSGERETFRIRCWDSCQLGHYGRMAGGGDPYADPAARVRHRIYHKFSYIPAEYGLVGCTGCGRCVQACPSGLDVSAVLGELAGEEEP